MEDPGGQLEMPAPEMVEIMRNYWNIDKDGGERRPRAGDK